MRDLGVASLFSAGAVGVPGDRRFYLAVTAGDDQWWFLCEKMQVAALAEAGFELLERHDLPGADEPESAFIPPGEVLWRVAQIGIDYDEQSGLIEIALVPGDDDEEPIRFRISPTQMGAMANAGESAVGAGRPNCPRCGLAMDIEGHVCPATNGDLRGHRP